MRTRVTPAFSEMDEDLGVAIAVVFGREITALRTNELHISKSNIA